MTLGCQRSPPVSGGVEQQERRENNREHESRTGVASVVTNKSREWSRKM